MSKPTTQSWGLTPLSGACFCQLTSLYLHGFFKHSNYWFISQVAEIARTRPIRSQEPRAAPGCPIWVQRPKHMGQPLPSHVHQEGTG